MPKKVSESLKYLFCALLLVTQFSCQDGQKNMMDYEVVLTADSAYNSFISAERFDIFMQLTRDIIKARLDNYGFSEQDYDLQIEDNRIIIKVYKLAEDTAGTEPRSILPVKLLATSQGSFRIYETFENMESQIILAQLDSAMKAADTAASVYDLIFVPEYYEDGEVIYHPTPVVGFVRVADTGNFFRIMRQYREAMQWPDQFELVPLQRQQNNMLGMVAVRSQYRDSALVILDQSYVRNVKVFQTETNVSFRIELNKTGTDIFTLLSFDNENRSLAIVLDGEVLFYPRLIGPITDGTLEFSSDMPFPEARALAVVINMKQLPLNVKVVITEKTPAE